ncbi:uncharacterized protein LOC110448865 [Mizuhopecten yessoensis]|uniref:Uncharacterized protein n=1 Tax=Mizuhopecten yessoensis TaxID=6573 RepID=A0A210QSF1_MIZYE|nr:uncharacterized protein LOC110448865 [Mizuhopecten yessoensis]OWF51656.1 hypothetical protein KP79_PYT11719 [Mizuhopecten yessoensis]
METMRYFALLFVLLFVPFVLGSDSVETDPGENASTCKGKDGEILLDNKRNLVRCLKCDNVAANVDHSTDMVCNCPEGRMCKAQEKEGTSTVTFEYYCTKKNLDISMFNSGLNLDNNEQQQPATESGR